MDNGFGDKDFNSRTKGGLGSASDHLESFKFIVAFDCPLMQTPLMQTPYVEDLEDFEPDVELLGPVVELSTLVLTPFQPRHDVSVRQPPLIKAHAVAAPPGHLDIPTYASPELSRQMLDGSFCDLSSAPDAPRSCRRMLDVATQEFWQSPELGSSNRRQEFTTLMVKNVPGSCTQANFLGLLDEHGLAGLYDFVYMPMDFRTSKGFGYVFVNMISEKAAYLTTSKLSGFVGLQEDGYLPLEVVWSEQHQGLAVHVERFRNSPVMHPDIPDQFKPMIFRGGVRQPFPPPTKKLVEPRRRTRPRGDVD